MNEHEVLAEWKLDEQAVRARLRPVGAPHPAVTMAGLSGMEVFEAISAGELPAPPMGETLDFVAISMAPGQALLQGRPLRRHDNPLGTVHGGLFATLLDSAVGCAIHTTLPAGRAFTTLEFKIDLIRALTDAVPLVRAEAKAIHVGRQVGR